MPAAGLPLNVTPTISGSLIHEAPAQHDIFGFKTTDANGDDPKCIHMGGVAVRTHAGVREGHASLYLDDG